MDPKGNMRTIWIKMEKKKTIGQEISKVSETTKRKQGWKKKCHVFKSRNGNLKNREQVSCLEKHAFQLNQSCTGITSQALVSQVKRLHQKHMIRKWNRDSLLRKEKNPQGWERSKELLWEPKSNGPWVVEFFLSLSQHRAWAFGACFAP